MKGIILAGGTGSRLYPITTAVSKQLIPIYDKPMIYYPLSTLMSAGIRDILIISTPQDTTRFKQLLGSGKKLGCQFSYKIQSQPRGLADAFITGADFIGNDKVCLILGDNIFHGSAMGTKLQQFTDPDGAVIFGYQVADPRSYAVVEFTDGLEVVSIKEKPKQPKSNYAIPGLYFFDNNVVQIAKNVRPSARGELEITSILNAYLKRGRLKIQPLGRGTAWLDTGTFSSMVKASQFVEVIEERQGVKIGCIEEMAFLLGYIDANQLTKIAKPLIKSGYGQYLLSAAKHGRGF